MGRTGAQSATLYNASNEAEYIQLRKLSQDGEYLNEGVTEVDLTGNLVYVEDRARLLLRFMDSTDIDLLRSWMRNRTPIKAVVFGEEDFIFWDEPSTIKLTEPASFSVRQRNRTGIELRRIGYQLSITKNSGFVLTASGLTLSNFVGLEAEDGIGIIAKSVTPASIGESGSISWMGQTLETTVLNTAD